MATIKFNNLSFEVGKFTFAQRLEHLKYLRRHYIDGVKEQIYGLPLPLCEKIWDKAQDYISRIDLGTAEYKAESFEIDSLVQALWLVLKDKATGFTLANALSVIEADIEEVPKIVAFDIMAFPKVVPPPASTKQNPPQTPPTEPSK